MRQYYRRSGEETRSGTQTKIVSGGLQAINTLRQDYRVYRLSAKECLRYTLYYLGLDACISYLFFYSWIAFIILLPGVFWFLREEKKALLKKRVREIKQQFMDGIQMLEGSLQAGYSVENAMKEAWKELQKVYSDDSVIVQEFLFMILQLDMNRNLEDLLFDFGQRSGVEDIRSFAEVFLTAKRTGGDILAIIRNTVFCIRQKQETMMEIETCLAGKMLEQNIMSLIPILILAYVKLTSAEFLSSMYGNLTGIAIMTICFGVYVTAYLWGRRIIQIEV